MIARALLVFAVLVLAAGAAGAQEPQPVAADGEDGEYDDDDEEGRADHKGFLFRLTFGLGWAFLNGEGLLEPAIGVRRVEDPQHNSPAFNLSMDFGGGFKDVGFHVGGAYERMILRADVPDEMGFTVLGVGGGLSYYFTDWDFYATAQARLVGLVVYLPGVLCSAESGEKSQSYHGPGLTAGLGKEWFGDNDKGFGLGVQLNYARLRNDDWMRFDYVSVMLALTFTKF